MLNQRHSFKYSLKSIFSLGSRLRSHFTRIRKTDLGLSITPDFKPRFCNNSNNSRAFFINPYLKERKERLKKHHENVVKVLQKWCGINLSPTDQKEGLYPTSFPLYIDVVEKIKSYDKFGEGLSHLMNKEYEKSWKLYNKIETLENSHNKQVSDFMKETEEKIRTSIANDAEISLEERNGFNMSAISSKNLSQTTEPRQDFRAYVQRTFCGYNLSSIFDHLIRRSIKKDDNTLDVGEFETSLGYLYPQLTTRNRDNVIAIIAVSLPETRGIIIKLKEIIDSIPQDTIKSLGDFDDDIRKMNTYLKTFQSCIEKIIHDEISLGLKGQCEKENRLRFRSVVANTITSFRSQL